MNWEAVGAISEVVGMLAVIVSLLYVSRQLRQGTDQLKLNSSQAIDTSNMQAFDPIYVPENSVIWTKGHADPDSLSAHEAHIFNMLMVRVFGASFNTTSYHYARGVFDPELYAKQAIFFSSLVATPGGSRWYANNRNLLHSETQFELDRLLQQQAD